ncbi:UNVERIFIED_CONTAM: hypothetical protein FKN15_046558 [Acipenser sinensis]
MVKQSQQLFPLYAGSRNPAGQFLPTVLSGTHGLPVNRGYDRKEKFSHYSSFSSLPEHSRKRLHQELTGAQLELADKGTVSRQHVLLLLVL